MIDRVKCDFELELLRLPNRPFTQVARTKAARLFASQGVSEMRDPTFSFSYSTHILLRFIVF